MPTHASKSTAPKGAKHPGNAVELLTAEHKAVRRLFKQFEDLADQDDADERKVSVVAQICDRLTLHARLEEEIFYPAMREALEDPALIDEADIEHATTKDLIAQLEGLVPGDDHYDARVTVLSEYVEHHVKEEESEMFEEARKAGIDTKALGARMVERKAELMAELGIAEDDDAGTASGKPAARSTASRR